MTSLNVIVKTAVMGEFALETLSANDIYNKEIEFYNNIAPKINKQLAKLNDNQQLIALPYGVCTENNAILFEDLSAKAYNISSVHRGFNFNEATIVLKKAATYHAINAVLPENQPEIFKNFKYGKFKLNLYVFSADARIFFKKIYSHPKIFIENVIAGLMSRHTNSLDTFYLTQFDVLMEVVSTWSDAEYYIPKLQHVRKHLMKKGAKAFEPDQNHFNTLIHGDMFVYLCK